MSCGVAATDDGAVMDLADVLMDEDILCDLLEPTGAACSFPWERCSYRLLDGNGDMYRSSPSPQVETQIDMERLPLLLGDPPTWTYYKNCTLPHITVRAHGVGMHALHLPDRASVLLSAVTLNAATGTAVSCGLDGDVHQPLVHGACSFASISFKTTSYNLKGKALHLLISLLAPEPTTGAGDGTGGCGGVSGGVGARSGNVMLASFLSPPLRVDARKRQTKERLLMTAATGKGRSGQTGSGADATAVTLTPFAPEVLERRLEKVAKTAEGGGKQLRSPIDNSIEGLRAYLSAVNIRPKCKHPLFLVLRFDTCVGLFYDTTRSSNPAEDVEAFQRMMTVLSIAPSKEGVPRGDGGVEFLVATKPDHEHHDHECGKSDCPVRLSAAISLPKGNNLPPQYQMLCDHQLGALRRTYCKLYDAANIACPHGVQPSPAPHAGETPPPCSTCGVQDPPLLFGAGEGGCSAADVCCALDPLEAHRHHGLTVCAASVPRLLGAVESLVSEGAADDQSAGCGMRDACPQAEWEQGLALMAAALSQHCRTRSAAEIMAFMRDCPDDRQKKRTLAV
jgi:hypothetical protein